MLWGDDYCMAKLGTSECNSPPPTSNSLGSYYLIIVWIYTNLSMSNKYIFCTTYIFFIKMKQLRFKSRSMVPYTLQSKFVTHIKW
jgi:hypothetical protein